MADQLAPPAEERLSCHACGSVGFFLFSSGVIACAGCLAIRAKLAPELVAAPTGEAPPADSRESWYFTFGLDHPLSDRYVVLRGTREGTRQVIAAVFGRGNWAAQYTAVQGAAIADQRKLRRLELSLA